MQLFIIVLLSSHVATVTAWAGCHRDRDKDHRERENCTALGFSDVVKGFEPTTKVMLFPNNLFSTLSWSSFQIFPAIYEIDLSGNKIPEVPSSVTPILPSLSVLRLGSNRLVSLSDGSFSACPALTELYLDHNAMESLSNHAFSGLSQLEILDLSSNHIKVLPDLMLRPLPVIETLYLEDNKIKLMPDNWFSPRVDVPYLFLSANPWACFCSLTYFHGYLDEYDFNVYIHTGSPFPRSSRDPDGESVVCDSPPRHKGTPLVNLGNSDLCSGEDEEPDATTPIPTTTPTTTTTTTTPPIPIPTTTCTTPAPTPPSNTMTTPIPTTTSTTTIPTTTAPIPTTTYTTPTPTTTSTTTPPSTTMTTPIPTTTSTTTPITTTTSTTTTPVPTITLAPHSTVLSGRPSTESPANMMPTKPRSTAAADAPTATLTPAGFEISAARGAGAFCFWLFAGCLLLCAVSMACILATLAGLIVWYRRIYKPLSMTLARRRGGEVMRLLCYNGREEREAVGGGGGGMELYRSVLFIHKEGGEASEREGEGGSERLLVTLEPTGRGGGSTREEGGGTGEKGVYRKSLYRMLSKEQEIEGWRGVTEECQVSVKDGGRKRGEERSEGGVSRKRYSVILREETEEAEGGREELDWVVGGWEVKRGAGGEEVAAVPRSSWGEWLAHYLPSMPWDVTTPTKGEATE